LKGEKERKIKKKRINGKWGKIEKYELVASNDSYR
jgi:hypothetical protein